MHSIEICCIFVSRDLDKMFKQNKKTLESKMKTNETTGNRFAFIQLGNAILGFGNCYDEAILDGMDSDNFYDYEDGHKLNLDEVKNLITLDAGKNFDGVYICTNDSELIAQYM